MEQLAIFSEFQSLIDGAIRERPANKSRSATALAARKFGVDADTGNLTLTLERSRINAGNLILWLKSNGKVIFKALVHLPPLFAIYSLHALRTNGKPEKWSIAFGLDAFLLASLPLKKRRVAGIRSDNTAIII